MGFRQESAALKVRGLTPTAKHVLQVLAFHACEKCGRSRPGVPLLMDETALAERAVREALETLRGKPELLSVYRYPRGGRGVTTEYIVMAGVARVSTADCGFCTSRGDTLHTAQGKRGRRGENPAPEGSKTLHHGGNQPSVQPQPSASLRSAAGPSGPEVEPPPPTPPLTSPTPPPAPQSATEVRELIDHTLTQLGLKRQRRTPPETATPS